MVLGIQVLGLLFGLFMMYLAFLHYKRKEFTVIEWSFWTIFTLLFMLISIFPGFLDPITESLRLARTMDLFIILGFMFLIGALFYVYLVMRHNQKQIEEVVRQIALKKK